MYPSLKPEIYFLFHFIKLDKHQCLELEMPDEEENFKKKFQKIVVWNGELGKSEMYYFQCMNCKQLLFLALVKAHNFSVYPKVISRIFDKFQQKSQCFYVLFNQEMYTSCATQK